MLSGLIVCMLVVGAIASKPGIPIGAMHGVQQPPHGHHEPCCAPRYFTFSQTTIITEVYDGSLSVESVDIDGAYDSISEQVSFKILEDFYNGTEVSLKAIDDYKKGVSYLIFKNGEEEDCYKSKTEGPFRKECVPEDATFVGEVTLGDYDIVVDNFYYSNEDQTEHLIKSVQHGGCVPISLLVRTFDPETGKEISVTDARVYDFNLGICDPEKYFKPPPSCDEGRTLAQPTPKMLKMRRKGLFY